VYYKGHLLYHAIVQHKIIYCISIEPEAQAEFSTRSLEIQTEEALRLWLDAVPDFSYSGGKVQVVRTDCDSKKYDLRLDIKHLAADLSSYQVVDPSIPGEPLHSQVFINTKWVFQAVDGKGYSFTDFFKLAPPDVNLENFRAYLQSLESKNFVIDDLIASTKKTKDAIFWTTYKNLLHEIGHSFGLCDTRTPDLIRRQCDPNFTPLVQSEHAVMYEPLQFYLTPDDLSGIRSLFARFAAPPQTAATKGTKIAPH